MQYNFDWNPRKAHANIYKHGVTFEEAVKVFDDPMALTVFDDEESSDDEDRWVTLGQINGQHYLVVVHTYRNANNNRMAIRLISAVRQPIKPQRVQLKIRHVIHKRLFQPTFFS